MVAVRRLLENDIFKLRLRSRVPAERLERRISWVVTSELIDPTPYLNGGELLIFTGMGLNVRDRRTWDAYVERLVEAGVTAVALRTGIVLREVPEQFCAAATSYKLPLLEIPSHVSLSAVEQFVSDIVRRDQSGQQDAAWRVAEQLARAAASGAQLDRLLRVLAEAIYSRVAILDWNGDVVASSHELRPGIDMQLDADSQLLLPIAGLPTHTLVIMDVGRRPSVIDNLEPIGSIFSMYLERRLSEPQHQSASWLARLEEQLASWEAPAHAIARSLVAADAALTVPVSLAIAYAPSTHFYEAYTIKLLLADLFDTVRAVARGTHVFIFLRESSDEAVDKAVELLKLRRPSLPIAFTGPTTDAEDLRLAYLAAKSLARRLTAPARASALDLIGTISSTASSGSLRAAQRFLKPIIDHDERSSSQLFLTLREYIRNDGKPGQTASALHMHRNTLSYRLSQIESRLGVSLSSIAGLATCHIALQLFDVSESDS